MEKGKAHCDNIDELEPAETAIELADIAIQAYGTLVSATSLGSPSVGAPAVLTAVVDLAAPIQEALPTGGAALTGMPKDIVAVIDVSGSMQYAMPFVKETLKTLINSIGDADRLAIITFNGNAEIQLWLNPMNDPTTKSRAEKIVSTLTATGNTNISTALDQAANVIRAGAAKPGAPPRMTAVLFLSDGEPNAGIVGGHALSSHVQKQLLALNNLPVPPLVVLHSLGFTTNHNSMLLRALTTTGTVGTGLYYFLKANEDISAAVGDALGSVASIVFHAVRIEGVVQDKVGTTMPGWICELYSGLPVQANEDSPTVHHIGYLSSSDQKNVVVACLPTSALSKKVAGTETPAAVSITVWYIDTPTGEEKSRTVLVKLLPANVGVAPPLTPSAAQSESSSATTVVVQNDDLDGAEESVAAAIDPIRADFDSLHVMAHVLRLRAAVALSRMSNSRATALEVETIHAQLVQLLSQIQTFEAGDKQRQATLARDESILLTLERDLGAAMEQIHHSGRLSAQDQMRVAQFSHEHAQQKSASSATELRPTYSTPEQEAMRKKFAGVVSEADMEQKLEEEASLEKAALAFEDTLDLDAEQIAKRKSADQDIQCFITLENWRASNIGIGLFVHPRTMRERYKQLVPQIELANDYVSTDAYNQGARADLRGRISVHAAGGSAMPSSTRGKINAWLPLYINATNWKYVRRYAPAAFSIIVRGSNDLFRPLHALQVCSRLMCTAVVQFCDSKLHFSEKAVQLYCDVHRLLLEMVTEYPDIQQVATTKLRDFIDKEWTRGRDITPDIGVLITYLAVADGATWADFRDAYVHESFRRSTRWIEGRIGRKLAPEEPDDELVKNWFEGTRVSTALMLFNVMFLELVARPKSCPTLDHVRRIYDSRWGRVSDDTVALLKAAYTELLTIDNMPDVFARVGMPQHTVAEIAELIRWALRNEKEIIVPKDLKRTRNVQEGNEAYKKMVVRRQLLSTAPSKAAEAARASLTLAAAYNACNSSAAMFNLGLSILQEPTGLGAVSDGPIGFLRTNKIENVSMLHCACDHTIAGRSAGLQAPEDRILKEMLFLVDGEPVLVLSVGSALISVADLASGLKATTAKLCPTEFVAFHTTFPRTCLPAFGHRTEKPVKTVVNAKFFDQVADKAGTVVFTSAGAEGFFFAVSVETLLLALAGFSMIPV